MSDVSSLSSSTASASSSYDALSSATSGEGLVLLLATVLLIGCLCSVLVKRFPRVPLPFTVLLLFVGVVSGAISRYALSDANNSYQQAIEAFASIAPELALVVFLPVLIFDSAFNVHYHLFAHTLPAILTLAFPGVLVSLAFTAVFAVYVFDYQWSWPQGLLLGAILGATDPVAIVSLLRELGSSQKLATLIEGESLINDGSAFVVYLLMQNVLLGGSSSASSIISEIFQYSLGGPAFGLACGIVSVFAMSNVSYDAEVEITITIGAAYLCFWIANFPLGVSAVLAVVVLGVYMAKHRYTVTPSVQPSLKAVWQLLIFAVNIFIFVLSGLIVADKLFNNNNNIRGVDVGWLFLLYALLHVSRYISILLFLPLFHRTGVHLTWQEIIMVGWSGMRGAVSLILALITYLQPRFDKVFRDQLTFLVSGIVVLTLVVNGVTSRYVLQSLQLHRGTSESRMVLTSAIIHMRQKTAEATRQMRLDPKFRAVNWEKLRPFLPQHLIAELQKGQGVLETEDPDTIQNRNIRHLLAANSPEQSVEVDIPHGGELPPEHPFHRMQHATDAMGDLTMAETPGTKKQFKAPGAAELVDASDAFLPSNLPVHHDVSKKLSQIERDELQAFDEPVSLEEAVGGKPSPEQFIQEKNIGSVKECANEDLDPSSGGPSGTEQCQLQSRRVEPSPHTTSFRSNPHIASTLLTQASPARHHGNALLAMFDEPSAEEAIDMHRPNSPLSGPQAAALPPPRLINPPLQAQYTLPPPNKESYQQFSAILTPPVIPAEHRKRRRYAKQFSSHAGLFSTKELHQKISLQKELSIRLLSAMAADYHRQFSAGLISSRTLRLLIAASDSAMDAGTLEAHWDFIDARLQLPWWLIKLFESTLNTVDARWTIVQLLHRTVHQFIRCLWMNHLRIEVELATAYLTAKQRMESVLAAFPEFDEIDVEVVECVRREAGYYQKKALAVWLDVCEGYYEAHAAVVTRHAAILLLHFQQCEIDSLQSTGMLEAREFDVIADAIKKRLLRLERHGVDIDLTPSIDILFQTAPFQCLPQAQQRRLRTMLKESRARRIYRTHELMWQKDEPCPGLLIIIRGTARVLFEYDDDCSESHHPLHRKPSLSIRNDSADHHSSAINKYRDDVRWHHVNTASGNDGKEEKSTDTCKLRFYDSRGRGSIVGAYEALTSSPAIASCSAATMIDCFILDQACFRVLMSEEDVAHAIVRAACVALLKYHWKDWNVEKAIGLSEYQLQGLVDRAAIHRITCDGSIMSLRYNESVLLLCGSAVGHGIKQRVLRGARTSAHASLRRLPSIQPDSAKNRQSPAGAATAKVSPLTTPSLHSVAPPLLPITTSHEPGQSPSSEGVELTSIHVDATPPYHSPRLLRALVLPEGEEHNILPVVSSSTNQYPQSLYRSPCLLQSRSGVLTLNAGAIVIVWTNRDQDISALFPPPPRADIRDYARQLGLTMQLGVSNKVRTNQVVARQKGAENGRNRMDKMEEIEQQSSSPSSSRDHYSRTYQAHSINSYLGTTPIPRNSNKVQPSDVPSKTAKAPAFSRDTLDVPHQSISRSFSQTLRPGSASMFPGHGPATPHYRNQSSAKDGCAILLPAMEEGDEECDDEIFEEIPEGEFYVSEEHPDHAHGVPKEEEKEAAPSARRRSLLAVLEMEALNSRTV